MLVTDGRSEVTLIADCCSGDAVTQSDVSLLTHADWFNLTPPPGCRTRVIVIIVTCYDQGGY